MKEKIIVLLVILIVACVGFGGYWLGRSNQPMVHVNNEPLLATPVVNRETPQASDADSKTEAARVVAKRFQSTYVPQTAASAPASTASTATHQIDQPKVPQKSAADIIAALEADDHKSAFPNPSIAPHQAMLSETPDPNWSQAATQQLKDYLAAQLGNRFEYPLVQCGQDICEIDAATLLGSDTNADVLDFQASDENMRLQPWWATLQFDELTFQVDTVDGDGRDVMIVFITRK